MSGRVAIKRCLGSSLLKLARNSHMCFRITMKDINQDAFGQYNICALVLSNSIVIIWVLAEQSINSSERSPGKLDSSDRRFYHLPGGRHLCL
jgi:hypothetical protein